MKPAYLSEDDMTAALGLILQKSGPVTDEDMLDALLAVVTKGLPVSEASPKTGVKAAEMAARRGRIAALALEHGPCSVRHLFYRAVVEGVPGITKNDSGYVKVQRCVLELRRSGEIDYAAIVDNTRLQRGPTAFDSVKEALANVAQLYRRNLWTSSGFRVEVWCESDSIASTVLETTFRWCVPVMICRGFASESFTYSAAQAWRRTPGRQPVVLYIGDHDPAGLNIEAKLLDRLSHFTEDTFDAIDWRRIGVTWDQVVGLELPGTPPKRNYGYPLAVEAEALPPRMLETLLDEAIQQYVNRDELDVLLTAEREEREWLQRLVHRQVAS